MAFQFRFKALLRYKEHLLSSAQMDLAAARREYESTKLRMEEIKEEQKQQRLVLAEKQRAGISAERYLLFLDYLTYLEQQLLRIGEDLHYLNQKVEKAREILLLRQKEVKMLEILREKSKWEYHKAMGKRELKQMDEKAIVSDSRRRMNLQSKTQELTDGAS